MPRPRWRAPRGERSAREPRGERRDRGLRGDGSRPRVRLSRRAPHSSHDRALLSQVVSAVRKYGTRTIRSPVNRIEIESQLNESRNQLLAHYSQLSAEQLRRPLTKSEHDPQNLWTALDHLGHLALIERNFQEMIRRHVVGHTNPVALLVDEQGATRTRTQIMAIVHAMTDDFQQEHRDDSFSEVVAFTSAARSATLQLLAELSDEQLEERLEGAPWADGTLGGVLGVNADHAKMHWNWVIEADLLSSDLRSVD